MASTFQPLSDCNPGSVIKTPAHPWGALADDTPAASLRGRQSLEQLALGRNITQTPEYLAANLPPYN